MKTTQVLGILAMIAGTPALSGTYSLPLADSGLVSVFPGQSAQLNVVNIGDPAKSCSFTLSFIDDSGTTLTPTLTPSPGITGGQSATLTVGPMADPTLLRAHIDFSLQMLTGTNTVDPMIGCYQLIPTFEVTDDTTSHVLNTRFYGMPSPIKGEKIEKVKICHKPGTPAEKTLLVPVPALRGHIGHGDTLGSCI
jgi:hypothetical protein